MIRRSRLPGLFLWFPGFIPVAAWAEPAQPPEAAAVGSLVQMILGLIAVLAAIGVTLWVLRRFGRFQAGADGALRILGGLSLGTRERVVLMQVGETQLLLGIAPGRVQTLHVLEQNVESGHGGNEPVFAQKLGALMKRTATRARSNPVGAGHEK